jgi:hypothetical protein
MPDAKTVAAMMKYNESLLKAGVLLAIDGLHPPSAGSRVSFSNGKPTVTDGPFTEAKESIGGYWMIQVKSKQEAIEWATRAPMSSETIEIRQVHEFSEFPKDVQEASADFNQLQKELTQKGYLRDVHRPGRHCCSDRRAAGLRCDLACRLPNRAHRRHPGAARKNFHNWSAWSPWEKLDPKSQAHL